MKKTAKKLYIQKKKRALMKIFGTPQKPRLAVFRSHKHIYAQLIDDSTRKTLVSSSTVEKKALAEFTSEATLIPASTQSAAFLIGQKLGQKAVQKKIQFVVFDRGNRPYLGRIQKLAEGAREGGLFF